MESFELQAIIITAMQESNSAREQVILMPDIATESWHLSILRAHQQDSVIPVLRQDADGVFHLLGRPVDAAFVFRNAF